MSPDGALPVPASLMTVLVVFAPLFTAPSFRTFVMLACGFLAQSGKRTVCGMLTGADLSRIWPHDRAHRFFSRARWNPDDLGIAAARLVTALLVPDGEPEGGGRRSGPRPGSTTGPPWGRQRRATGTTGWCSPSASGCP